MRPSVRYGGIVAFWVSGLYPGCRSEPSGEASPPASASAPSPSATPRCGFVSAAPGSFTVGSHRELGGDGDDEPLDLPFSVELGAARPTKDGFVMVALDEREKSTHAVLLTVNRDGEGGKAVDLGVVHGNALPGMAVPIGDRVLVLVPDGSAGGTTLRLATVALDPTPPVVSWGGDVPQDNDDSAVFDAEVVGDRGLVVWDQWDRAHNVSVVVGRRLELGDLSKSHESRELSPPKVDAESPRLATRGKGYWLSWVETTPADRTPPPRKEPGSEEPAAWVLGKRRIVVMPLSLDGTALGKPVFVTPEDGHVLAFDLMASSAEHALVVWRDDETSPATPGGRLLAAVVRADGSVEHRVIAEEGVGAGVPQLLSDARGAEGAWVVFPGQNDTVHLAVLDPRARLSGAVSEEASLRGVAPLALSADRLLVARPRGRRVELSVAVCRR